MSQTTIVVPTYARLMKSMSVLAHSALANACMRKRIELAQYAAYIQHAVATIMARFHSCTQMLICRRKPEFMHSHAVSLGGSHLLFETA